MTADPDLKRWLGESDEAFAPSSWEAPAGSPAAEGYDAADPSEAFEPWEASFSEDLAYLETPGVPEAGGSFETAEAGESFDQFESGYPAESFPAETGGAVDEYLGGWGEAERWTPEEASETDLEQPQDALLAELLAEDAVVTAGGEALGEVEPESEQLAPEQFTGMEHKSIGDAGAGGAASSILYGSPPKPLSFGDVVAMAGDYFGEYDELAALGRTDAGRRQLAWARWHCLSGPGFSEPEPRVPEVVKKAVRDRYYQLASANFSHFSAGGTAWQTYTKWHGTAVAAALDAGTSRRPEQWRIALSREAFADHFLTDAFSAGHIRTPRTAMKDWYARQFPAGAALFVRYMARFMYRALDAQGRLPWLLTHLEGLTRQVIEGRIRSLGGEALGTFSLGDIVSKALHDYDNANGLVVVSDVDASGRAHPGGFRWQAIGDAHLAKHAYGPATRAMAVAAVGASIRDLRRVRDAGARIGSRRLTLAERTALVRRALGTPIFEARRYLPRERVGDPKNPAVSSAGGARAPLEWRWGQLGPLAYQAVDRTVKGDIVDEMVKLAGSIDDSATRLGMTVTGIRGAYGAFLRHLKQDGIRAVEAAVGRRAR